MNRIEYVEQILLLEDADERERRFRLDPRLKEFLPELYRLDGVPQPPDFHPEGDVLTHTLLAVRHLPSGADRRLAWGALLHDVGKSLTTREIGGRIRAFGHDREGALLTGEILRRMGMEAGELEDVVWLVRNHMFALAWQVEDSDRLSRRQQRFIGDPRFPLLLDLMEIDALASGSNVKKLGQVDFYRKAMADSRD